MRYTESAWGRTGIRPMILKNEAHSSPFRNHCPIGRPTTFTCLTITMRLRLLLLLTHQLLRSGIASPQFSEWPKPITCSKHSTNIHQINEYPCSPEYHIKMAGWVWCWTSLLWKILKNVIQDKYISFFKDSENWNQMQNLFATNGRHIPYIFNTVARVHKHLL